MFGEEHITVESVAKYLKVSRRLLEMRFRELRGCTVSGTITAYRLEATKRALESSTESIAEICARTGWNDEIHPKKVFKHKFGMTMSDWRKNHK